MSIDNSDQDLHFMQEALKLAKRAAQEEEVPVGAVLVFENKVIAKGYNQVEKLKDATAHAEILCLSGASSFFNNWRLQGSILYSTLEPCIMCAGAIIAARIERLVWGAPDFRLGANGSLVDIFKLKHPMHQVKITSGVLESNSAELMREFFQQRRKAEIDEKKLILS